MTLPTTTTLNDCEPDDSDMFGPPRSSPPPSHHRGIDGTNNHNHRSRVPMISPKLRQREERKRILQLCAHKLERIKDSETNLRRSVCINNTYCRLNDELRREKQSRYLANLPKSESKPETAHDNIFNPYNSCSLDSSNHQSNAQQQHNNNNNNTISSNDSNNNNNKSNSNSTSTAAQSTNSYLHNHHNRLHKNHLNIVDVDDDEDDNDGIDEEDDDIDDAIINNRYDSDMNNSLCDIENQPALGHHQGQLGYNNNNNSSNNNNNNSHKQHATETYSSCVATSHALIENLNQNLNIITTTSLLNGPSMNTNTITSALSTITTTTHTTTVSSSSSSVTNTSIAPATITSTATATATATQISPRKRHISSNNIDTDLERLDRELNAINAPMLLIDPEITQGAEHLERAISSRKRLRSEDESDRLVREALQFYIPPQRFISAIEDCPLDIVGVGNCGLNMGNISPKRQKLSSQDLDLDFDVNQNSKDFEVIMDALRLGTPSPTSSDSCGQAAMMSEAASVFHNLVVTSLET